MMRAPRTVLLSLIFAACAEDDLGLDGSVADTSVDASMDAAVDAGPTPGRDAGRDASIEDAADAGERDSGPPLDSGCVATATAASFEYRALPEPGRPRHNHAAGLLPDGRVILAGGFSNGIDFDPDVELFDPEADAISEGPPRPFMGAVTTGVTLPDGRLFVVAGPEGPSAIFDVNGGWTRTATTPNVFAGALLALGDGRVLAVGGSKAGTSTDSVHLYDPETDRWSILLTLTQARGGPGAVVLADGRVLVVGGGAVGDADDSTEFIDVEAGTTTPGPTLTVPRTSPHALLLLDRRVLVHAGNGLSGRASEIYDPLTDTFTALPGEPQQLVGESLVRLCDGRVVQVGGRLGSNPIGDTTAWVFDPSADRWRPSSAFMPSRQFASATLLLDGRVLVFGGNLLQDPQPLSAYVLLPDLP